MTPSSEAKKAYMREYYQRTREKRLALNRTPEQRERMRQYEARRRADPEKYARKNAARAAWRAKPENQAKEAASRAAYKAAKRHLPVARRAMLKANYGISDADYNALLSAQGGVCGICGNACPSGRRLAVDHEHVTGQVRGLLCAPCNLSLGGFRDSITLLAKAAAYLTRPPAYEILAPLDVSTTGE